MFPDLLAWLEKIPATLWGIVIGSFIALGGVYLTNRAQDRRQQAQLAHDRELRNRDREFALRRDVYLAASEAMSACTLSIVQFGNLDIPHDQVVAGYIDKLPSIAKIDVIASEQTVRAVREFIGELGAAYMRLSPKRITLDVQKRQLNRLQEQAQRISGPAIAENAKQIVAAAKSLTGQLKFQEECNAEVLRLSRLLISVLLSVRSELELPLDEAGYRNVVEASLKKQEAGLKDLLQPVQAFLDQLSPPRPSPEAPVPKPPLG